MEGLDPRLAVTDGVGSAPVEGVVETEEEAAVERVDEGLAPTLRDGVGVDADVKAAAALPLELGTAATAPVADGAAVIALEVEGRDVPETVGNGVPDTVAR